MTTAAENLVGWNGHGRRRWAAVVLLCASFPIVGGAQSLKGCRTVYVQPMPESLDRFVSAELVNWGAIKVVTVEDKADCVAAFGRQASKLQVKSTGSANVPKEASVTAEDATDKLPISYYYAASAALELVHRDSSVVVWASAKSSYRGPMALARQLVDQLKKDYQKAK
jgi:hypothetical protein